MAKFQFACEVVADEDPKSSIIAITSITDEQGKKFALPKAYRPAKLHTELIKLPEFKRIANTLTRRGQYGNVWISLPENVLKIYVDESGNMSMNDYLLEEISTSREDQQSTSSHYADNTLVKLLEKLCEREDEQKDNKNRNLNKLCEKFVLEKFENKKMNANKWLQMYEKECDRLNIDKDAEKIEALRLLLDDSAKDWFGSMLIKYTLNSEWSVWKENFLQSFADKGWPSVTYALNYKYFKGSILEYALKKEHLLLESNNKMDQRTLVDLIASGIPTHIRNRIDRQDTTTPTALFSELRKFENIENKSNKGNDNKFKTTKFHSRINLKQPCKICESKGKGNRFHPEETCWFKDNKTDRMANTLIEIENTEDPKN
uniref:Retrotransposon gag domain-containing protein n=1 Tax=Trichogramma kaykai TaxID=54128 RepID=A0ABD2X8K2_9HYME